MNQKIDRRISYKIMLDTETCGTLECPFVYDFGFAVVDKRGKIYEKFSFIIQEVFFGMADLMRTAYYANKIPTYLKDIYKGKRQVVSFWQARAKMIEIMKKYETNVVVAHNAYFDYNSLNNTLRYLTKSKYRYFFPYDTIVWDTLKMARQVIAKTPTYIAYCKKNGYIGKNHQVRLTAEILYRFISNNLNFIESHTGLEDVLIEAQILAFCFRKKKKMVKELWVRA